MQPAAAVRGARPGDSQSQAQTQTGSMTTIATTRSDQRKDGHHHGHQEDQAQHAEGDGQLGDGQAEGSLAGHGLTPHMRRVILT